LTEGKSKVKEQKVLDTQYYPKKDFTSTLFHQGATFDCFLLNSQKILSVSVRFQKNLLWLKKRDLGEIPIAP
jgi:hypothetical protein